MTDTCPPPQLWAGRRTPCPGTCPRCWRTPWATRPPAHLPPLTEERQTDGRTARYIPHLTEPPRALGVSTAFIHWGAEEAQSSSDTGQRHGERGNWVRLPRGAARGQGREKGSEHPAQVSGGQTPARPPPSFCFMRRKRGVCQRGAPRPAAGASRGSRGALSPASFRRKLPAVAGKATPRPAPKHRLNPGSGRPAVGVSGGSRPREPGTQPFHPQKVG